MNTELSIYVHIPFCVRKCLYCDFLSFNAGSELIESYFNALGKELLLWSKEYKDYEVISVFIGGGTPSFVDSKYIVELIDLIKERFTLLEDAEITIEANPASAMFEKLRDYHRAGINRLSIGAQSLSDEEIKRLGRVHNSQMFLDTFENARMAGFDNINVDVMSALPGQNLESYLQTLHRVTELHPEHISAYSLIVEEGTPFFDMELELPDEETDRLMYHETLRQLTKCGYHRYEISNYALGEDYECRHNKVYWQRGNYLGVGIGAASMVENQRWNNTRDIKEYIAALESSMLERIRTNKEALAESSQMEEFMFLGLRLTEGVSMTKFRELFGQEIADVYGNVISKYENMGLLERADHHLRLTEKGLDVSNTVMAEFLL